MSRIEYRQCGESGEYWTEAVVNNVVIGEVGKLEDGTPAFWPNIYAILGALPVYIIEELVETLHQMGDE